MKHVFYSSLLLLVTIGAAAQKHTSKKDVFEKGNRGSADFFTGIVWVNVLVPADTTFNTQVGNVTFEVKARTHWHTHEGGQLLLVTNGVGYYQERGKKKQIIREGDAIKCMPNVEHWHGATEKSSMTHVAINTNTQKKIVTWLKPVTDEEFIKEN